MKRATYDVSQPNGVLISRNQKTLYVAQSDHSTDQPRQLRACPINDDGSLGSDTTLHTFRIDHRGVHRVVDGMTLDVEANIVACAGFKESGPGPMIYAFSPTGKDLGDTPHARGSAHQLLLRRCRHADAIRDHRRRPPVPRADGPHGLDNVAGTGAVQSRSPGYENIP